MSEFTREVTGGSDSGPVTVLCSHPWPGNISVANRVSSFVEALVENGPVTVVCAASDKPPPAGVRRRTVFDPTARPARSLVTYALGQLLQTAVLAFEMLRVPRGETVIVTLPSIFLLFVAALRPRATIVDVRDLAWEYIPARGLGGIVRPIMYRIARSTLHRASAVSVTNVAERDYLRARFGISPYLIPNGVERDRLAALAQRMPRPNDGETPSGNDGDRPTRFLYLGNVGRAQAVPELIEVVSELADVHLDIVGGGNDLPRAQAVARQLGADNVQLHGPVDRAVALDWYHGADIVVVTLAPGFESAVPSKLYECLATGRPLLFVGTGAAASLLGDFAGVVIVNAHTAPALRDGIARSRDLVGQDFSSQRHPILQAHYSREAAARTMLKAVRRSQGGNAACTW